MSETFGETLTDAIDRANRALGDCDYGFEQAWDAFAERLLGAGLDKLPLALLDGAIRHLPPRVL